MKIRNLRFLCAFILAMAVHCSAFAEGGCPPGSYPQQGQGWQTCVPIPGSNSVPDSPPVIWEDRWGALSEDQAGQIGGASKNQRTEQQAVDAAIDDCKAYGGNGCHRFSVYSNQCIAVVTGDKKTSNYGGKSEDEAARKGMSACHAEGQGQCRVFYSGCSLPVRTQ